MSEEGFDFFHGRYAIRGDSFASIIAFIGPSRRLSVPRDDLTHHFDEALGLRLVLVRELE